MYTCVCMCVYIYIYMYGGHTEIGLGGWQLFRFRRVGTGEEVGLLLLLLCITIIIMSSIIKHVEVVGYGHFDGATGSVALRLPEHSVAVLLSSIDLQTRSLYYSIL